MMKRLSSAVRRKFKSYGTLALILMAQGIARAQIVGINVAKSTIEKSFGEVQGLIYVIAAVVGLVGGVRIYNKWTNGDHDINKEIVGWGGAALFLTIVPTLLKSMFNITA